MSNTCYYQSRDCFIPGLFSTFRILIVNFCNAWESSLSYFAISLPFPEISLTLSSLIEYMYLLVHICNFHGLSYSLIYLFHNILILFSKLNSSENCTSAPLTSCILHVVVKNNMTVFNAVDKCYYKLLVKWTVQVNGI